MAARRRSSRPSQSASSSRSRASSAGRNRRSRAPQGSNAGPAILAGLVMLALIVGAVAMFGQGGIKVLEDSKQAKPPAEPSKVAQQPNNAIADRNRGKKQPDRPAPRLTAANMAACEKHYAAAKVAYNLGLKEQQGRNDKVTFQRHMRAAVDQVKLADEIMDAVLEWDEEADWEDWIVPEHIRSVMAFWGKMAKLKARAHKVLPAK